MGVVGGCEGGRDVGGWVGGRLYSPCEVWEGSDPCRTLVHAGHVGALPCD